MNEALKAKIERVAEKCLDSIELFIEESKKSGEYGVSFEVGALRQITEVICKLDTYNSKAYPKSLGLTCKDEKTPYKV